jgi:hypothetical protein
MVMVSVEGHVGKVADVNDREAALADRPRREGQPGQQADGASGGSRMASPPCGLLA